jgi:hypothetical protein
MVTPSTWNRGIPPMFRAELLTGFRTGSVPLVFVEVQHGDCFGEDDIVRLDDDYGRLKTRALPAD